jgi:hypothetical protein
MPATVNGCRPPTILRVSKHLAWLVPALLRPSEISNRYFESRTINLEVASQPIPKKTARFLRISKHLGRLVPALLRPPKSRIDISSLERSTLRSHRSQSQNTTLDSFESRSIWPGSFQAISASSATWDRSRAARVSSTMRSSSTSPGERSPDLCSSDGAGTLYRHFKPEKVLPTRNRPKTETKLVAASAPVRRQSSAGRQLSPGRPDLDATFRSPLWA